MRACVRATHGSCVVSLAILAVLMAGPATAQIVRFDGVDPGAGPVSARPNSYAAAGIAA